VPAHRPGLKFIAELWNPRKADGESLVTLENQPTAISDAVNPAWFSFMDWHVHNVPSQLFGPDRLHALDAKIPAGISLYKPLRSSVETSGTHGTNIPP
jgi:hypothetical protein